MEQPMTYQRYTYLPYRGRHNVFTPEELAELQAIDKTFDFRPKEDRGKEIARQHRYYNRNHARILERERKRREARRKQMEAAK